MTPEEKVKRAEEIQGLLKNAKTPIEWLEAQLCWVKEIELDIKSLILIKMDQFQCEKCPRKHQETGISIFMNEQFAIEHSKNMTAISMLELSKQKISLRELGFSFDFPVEIEETFEEEITDKGFVN